MILALTIVVIIFAYALTATYMGTKNKHLWETRHKSISRGRGYGCDDYFCSHGFMRFIGYPLWPIVYPCSLVFSSTDSRESSGTTRAERKHEKKMAEAKRARKLQQFEHDTRLHGMKQAEQITELLRKSNTDNSLTL